MSAGGRSGRAGQVIIAGQGRSGTNWLLCMFDLSPETHCRNEPNSFESSPFWRLPPPTVWREGNARGLESTWDEAVAWAHERMGERDPRAAARKAHVHGAAQSTGLLTLVQRGRSRALLGRVAPALREQEWRPPRWLVSRARLARATPVLKFSQLPGWIPWLLHHRPEAHAIHIVRHPGGFLSSWMSRFLERHDREETAEANRARLREVCAAAPAWSKRFGDIAPMSAEEAELWYWLYCTETIHAAAPGAARYELVVYEDLLADVVGVMRPIFGRAGIAWSTALEKAVAATSTFPPGYADAWRSKLAPAQMDLVERILDASGKRGWWSGAGAGGGAGRAVAAGAGA